MNDVKLAGCRSTPLASYLKGIGVLRLLSLQADRDAMGSWNGDEFVITSRLNADEIVEFILHKYSPTPVMSPWNGGSGFYSKGGKKAVEQLRDSIGERFAIYRECLKVAYAIVEEMGLDEKPDQPEKRELIIKCRSSMPDAALDWIDTSVILIEDSLAFPPLLGTGGNDGNFEFGYCFMQRICEVFDSEGQPSPNCRDWLTRSLFGLQTGRLVKGIAIGQFNPIAAGGVNAQSSFESASLVNPWDYILTIEGALSFASASVKRMGDGTTGIASCPFTVRPAQVGYISSAEGEECKAEVWMPLWNQPCRYRELRSVFGEGRASIKRRFASNGYDFALAISQLGVERGISSFIRYGMNVRNGRSVLAVPLDNFQVARRRNADLLVEIDPWIARFSRRAGVDEAPAGVRRSWRSLMKAVISLCKNDSPDNLCSLIIALGECERQNAHSRKWCQDEKKGIISPIPPIASRWAIKAYDGSSEFRLAAAIASLRPCSTALPALRMNLEPVVMRSSRSLAWSVSDGDVAWGEGGLVRSLNDIMYRRMLTMQKESQGYSEHASVPAPLSDVRRFIEGEVDEVRLESLIWGLGLIDWSKDQDFYGAAEVGDPGAAYGVLRLYYSDLIKEGRRIPLSSVAHAMAASGAGPRAFQVALRGLRGIGYPVRLGECRISPERSRRIAASMLIQLDKRGHETIKSKMIGEEFLEE